MAKLKLLPGGKPRKAKKSSNSDNSGLTRRGIGIIVIIALTVLSILPFPRKDIPTEILKVKRQDTACTVVVQIISLEDVLDSRVFSFYSNTIFK